MTTTAEMHEGNARELARAAAELVEPHHGPSGSASALVAIHSAQVEATLAVAATIREAGQVGSPEACGSYRVTREVEGMAAEAVWCPRTSGPCPYPGTFSEGRVNHRGCAASSLGDAG